MRKIIILPKLGPSGHCAQPNDYNSLSRQVCHTNPKPSALLSSTQVHTIQNFTQTGPLTDAHPHLQTHPPPPQVIGAIDGSGRIRLVDRNAPGGAPAVDLDLDQVLGKMPNKTFEFKRRISNLAPLELPAGATPQAALERVLRLPAVGSKRFLTTKVDRHVTGALYSLLFTVVVVVVVVCGVLVLVLCRVCFDHCPVPM